MPANAGSTGTPLSRAEVWETSLSYNNVWTHQRISFGGPSATCHERGRCRRARTSHPGGPDSAHIGELRGVASRWTGRVRMRVRAQGARVQSRGPRRHAGQGGSDVAGRCCVGACVARPAASTVPSPGPVFNVHLHDRRVDPTAAVARGNVLRARGGCLCVRHFARRVAHRRFQPKSGLCSSVQRLGM